MAVVATSAGWSAQYFDATGAGGLGGVDFDGTPLGVDTLAEIQEFSFTDGFLDGGPSDDYAASYTGTITLDEAETATFNLKASGTAELWIDGVLVAQAQGYDTDIVVGPCGLTGNPVCLCAGDKAAVAQVNQGVVDLTAGTHTIEVRFLDERGSRNDILALDWRLGGEENGFTSMQLAEPNAVTQDLEGDGEWSGLFSAPLLAIHQILTPDGKVLMYGADEQGNQGGQWIYSVWDPETHEYYVLDNATETDIFCSVPLIVPETGEILIIGGDTRGLDIGVINNGVNDVNTFDYQTMELTESATGDMEFARWYPTMITLPSGQLLILGGRDFDGTYVGYPEIYTPGEGWRTLTGAYIGEFDIISDYPRAWVTSDGRIITYAAQGTWEGAVTSIYEMDASGNGSVKDTGVDIPVDLGWYMPAVMYDVDKALIIAEDGSAWILDMSNGGVALTQTADIGPNRIWSDMTVMPDGRVIVTGGSATDTSNVYNAAENTSTSVMIWDPDTGQWTEMADESTGRYYHSTLLLLPDGTFLSSGGGAPGPLANTNSQIYTPDYLFDENGELADRPVIEDVPADTLNVGDVFQITVDDASAITELALMPFDSVTHSYNQAARRVEVDFVQIDDTTIEVTLPSEGGTIPPGYWHLFALNDAGTPSVSATLTIAPSEAYYMPSEMPLGLDFILNGDSEYNAATNEVIIVPDEINQMGSAGLARRFDFSKDFYISFDLHMGDDDAGADGFAFVLHNDFRGASSVGSGGSYGELGAYWIQYGLAIEFDIFDNGEGDIAEDHTNIFDTETREQLTAPVALTDLENNVWRTVEVSWDVETQTLVWSVDGVQMGQLVTDLANDHFNGSDLGWVTFTGATGGASNQMKVSLNAIDATDENGAPVIGEVGDNDAGYIENLAQHIVLSGDAEFGARSRVNLTDDTGEQTGGAMSAKRVDFTKDFAISFDMMFGAAGADGGDGAAFVFHNAPDGADALGNGGADLGARWLGSGLAIEFDTYFNEGRDGDIANDHTAVFDTDGAVIDPLDPTNVDLDAARVLDPVSLGELENGLWHRVEITWNATAQQLEYSIDGVVIATIDTDLINEYFDGSQYAYFGWTAATGISAHETSILPVTIQATFEDGSAVDDAREDNPDGADGNTAPIAQDYDVTLLETAGPTSLTDAILAGVTDPDGEAVRIVGFLDDGAEGVVALSEGNLTYRPGPAFEALNAGEQAVDSFTVNVADIHGAITPLTVTVTVEGVGAAGDQPDAGFVDAVGEHFTVSGDAAFENGNGFLLTEAVGGQTGGAMSNERVDMAEDFEVVFDINLGALDGADGLAFVFHNDPAGADALGVGAADFGARYIGDGLAIEFDTFGNLGRDADIAADHTNIFDTDVAIVADDFSASRVTDPTALANLEDGEDHRVVVSWNATTQTLSYSVDGVLITTLTADLVAEYFGGSQFVHFGWTAGTGGTAHESHVAIQSLMATYEDGTQVDDATGAADDGGAGDGGEEPVNTPPVAGDIAVDVDEDAISGDLAPALLAAATDDDGDALTITGVDDAGLQGQVTLVGGQLFYNPNGAFDALGAGEQAVETFDVTIADGNGGEDVATVTVTITGVDETAPDPDFLLNNFTVSGDAAFSGAEGFLLTEAVGGQTGGAMSNGRVDMSEDFEVVFDLNFGAVDGADGLAFVFHNAPAGAGALGVGAADFGARYIGDGLAIEFDTFGNLGRDADIAADHTNIFDTDVAIVADDFSASRVTDPTALADLEDGEDHRVVVSWNATTQTLSYSVDGVLITTLTADLVAEYFGGSQYVHFGWTAGTGGTAHESLVTVQSIAATAEDGSAFELGAGGGDAGGGDTGGGDPTNTPPVAGDIAVGVDEDAISADLAPALLAAATDDDGDALTITGVDDAGLQGQVTLVGGQLFYNPNGAFDALGAGEQAVETFDVTIADGNGGEDVATVTVTISGVDETAPDPDFVLNNFTVSGDAAFEGAEGFLLTEAVGGQTGGAMSNDRIDMGQDFEVVFSMNFGAADGADGMAFVFHNAPAGAAALGVGAADFGARYLGDGLAIEFDTFGNIGRDADIAADHTNIFDTDVTIVADDFSASRVTDPTALGELEDGADHEVTVSWDAATQTLSYSVDGVLITTLTSDLVAEYFGGSQFVHFGWTAGTGGTAHESHVAIQSLAATYEDGTVVDLGGAGDGGDGGGDPVDPPANTPPVAGDVAVAVGEDAASADLAPAVLAAASDADGDGLEITGFDDTGVQGLVTLVGGQLVYDPDGAFEALAAGEQAVETFDVTIADGNGGEDVATVTVTINGADEAVDPPVNTDPVAGDIGVTLDEATGSGDLAPAALAAAFDGDGDPLAIDGVDVAGTQGQVTFVGGQIFYDPNGAFDALGAGEQAFDSFDFIIDDGQGGQDVGTVTVTITGVADADPDPDPGAGGGYGETEPTPTILGTEAGETLRGDDGDDVVSGLGGPDNLWGGEGDDVLLGGEGADTLKGNGGDDDLRGGGGDDQLKGQSGQDTLWGGAGDDELIGGADADVFVFGVGDDADTITDFTADDSLLLHGTSFADGAEALAAAIETAEGLLFDLGDGDTLLLVGEDKDSVGADAISIL